MYDNYNYPMGADTPDAPWNQEEKTEEVEIVVSQTLSKTNEIKINEGEEDKYKEFYIEQHYTPMELISLFKSVLERVDIIGHLDKKMLIEECSNWIEDDFEVCEN